MSVLRRMLSWLLRWGLRAVWTLTAQVFIVAFAAVLWLSLSSQAPAWVWERLAPQVPELTLTDISGRFATGLRIGRLHWANDKLEVTLDGIRLRWQAAELLQGRLVLDALQVSRVAGKALQASAPEALTLPALDIPLAWFLRDARVGRLEWLPHEGEAMRLEHLALNAEGGGHRMTLTELTLQHALASLRAQGHVDMQDAWPLDLVLVASAKGWPDQRITAAGDLSRLDLRARGPQQWPFDLAVRANVLPIQPVLDGALRWPRWQPPGQQDWRLEAGGLRFAGTTASGKAVLQLSAVPLSDSKLPWPSDWPRKAELAGPLTWHTGEQGSTVDVNWQGRFGGMPWTVVAALDSNHLERTRLLMQLADARLKASGWPADRNGLDLALKIPQLQRFQTFIQGAAELQGQWRGMTPETGRGRLVLSGRQWRQGDMALADRLNLIVSGSLARQSWQIDGVRDDFSASLGLQGGMDLNTLTWQGQLQQGVLGTSGGEWRLQAPAALSLSATANRLAEQCWQMAPWRLCAQADLLPARWTAQLRGESGGDGSLLATLRRDPRQDDPPLDADVLVRDVNLARLPVSLPAGLDLRGKANARARLSGTLAAPLLNGEFNVAGTALKMPAYGLDWPDLQLQGRLLGDHMDWRGSVRDAGGGEATLTGTASLRPAFSLQARLSGQRLRAAYAPWVAARVSPDLTLSIGPEKAVIRGEVVIPEAEITLKQLESAALKPSSDVRIVRDRHGRQPVAGASGEGLPLDISVAVVLGEQVKLSGYGLEAGLLGRLQLLQRPGEVLSANGELRLSDDAVYEAYGQRLTITTGRFLFAGPVTRPDIRLEAEREVDGVTVGIRVTGRAQAPQIELYADEPMAQEEILSMLVLGRSLSNTSSPTAAERQALALGAALKLGGRSGALERLGGKLGIKDFALGTEGESDQTLVAVSGYIRPDLYLSFGMGVFEPTQSLKMRYQFSKKLSLEAVTSLESAITLFYSWRF